MDNKRRYKSRYIKREDTQPLPFEKENVHNQGPSINQLAPPTGPQVQPPRPVPPTGPEIQPPRPVPPTGPEIQPPRPVPPTGPQIQPPRPVPPTGPEIQPPRPVPPTGPQIQPPRPVPPTGPQIQPPRPVPPTGPQIQPPRPPRPEPPRPPRPEPPRPPRPVPPVQPPRPPQPPRPEPPVSVIPPLSELAPIDITPPTGQVIGRGSCMGSASASYTSQIETFIRRELTLYQAFIRWSDKSTRYRQALRALAAENLSRAKQLDTAYYNITGERYWPTSLDNMPLVNFNREMMQLYTLIKGLERDYLAGYRRSADQCLGLLYLKLADRASEQAAGMR